MPRGRNSTPTELTRAIAGILYDAFQDLLITQEQFGQIVGVSSSIVSVTFLGDRVPDLALFFRMCEAVNLPAASVITKAQDILNS